MTSVLITRPAGAAESLAAELTRCGYDAVTEPLLTIAPLAIPAPQIEPDAVVITSSNALQVFETRPRDLSAFFKLPCFCVGPRTAERARHFGFTQVRHGDSDGTALAHFIAASHDTKNGDLLHLTARHADGKARKELEALGYHVHEWPVYDAVPETAFSPDTLALLKSHGLDAVTFFSPRTAEVFVKLLARHALEACCKGLAAICLSQSVAAVLRPFDWRHLAVAPKPTEDDLVACLKETCPVNGNDR